TLKGDFQQGAKTAQFSPDMVALYNQNQNAEFEEGSGTGDQLASQLQHHHHHDDDFDGGLTRKTEQSPFTAQPHSPNDDDDGEGKTLHSAQQPFLEKAPSQQAPAANDEYDERTTIQS